MQERDEREQKIAKRNELRQKPSENQRYEHEKRPKSRRIRPSEASESKRKNARNSVINILAFYIQTSIPFHSVFMRAEWRKKESLRMGSKNN